MELFLGVIFVIAIYFLPGIVAHVRGHNDENSIVLLNFFAGRPPGRLSASIFRPKK